MAPIKIEVDGTYVALLTESKPIPGLHKQKFGSTLA
jgi:hypothetical protein